MIGAVLATIAVGFLAGFVYVGRERLGIRGLGLAALRTLGLGALFFALFNPGRFMTAPQGPPIVLLDASLSMGASGGRWQQALDTARTLARGDGGAEGGGTILRFGAGLAAFDSSTPDHGTSLLRDALAASVARGGAVIVVSDGEIQDGATLPQSLAHGVGAVVLPRDTVPNAALRFDHEARLSEHTVIQATGPARWRVAQTLLDPDDDGSWAIEAEVDLSDDPRPTGPLLRLLRIGP